MNQPRYCTRCGALLGRSKPRLTGYDGYTGLPHHEVDYRCPNRRWWNLWHDRVTITNDPIYTA